MNMPANNLNQHLVLRPAAKVMRLSRLGSFHQTRISFVRSLLRRIASQQWRLTKPVFDLDDKGYGAAVYRVETPDGVCSLVVFSNELDAKDRSDRVIATKWDATFTLMLGEPGADDIERLRQNVPKQEASRVSAHECVLGRANRSMRLFGHVIDCLAQGQQPTVKDIVDCGYLMRTTAVYGNGKFGLSDLANTFACGLFRRPFEAEMLAVYLIREFTIDLVEHIAARRAPDQAVRLASEQKRAIGIGNSTGLGMAPFLIAHPTLIHRWIVVREIAIARVVALPEASPAAREQFVGLLQRARRHVAEWHTSDARQAACVECLNNELNWLSRQLPDIDAEMLTSSYPWKRLVDRVEAQCSEEMQELVNSLIVEPYGELVDDLADAMADPETPRFDPTLRLGKLRQLIEQHYDWALQIDFHSHQAQHFFWYRSEEKEEPRLGERYSEAGAEREMRFGIARDVQQLYRELADCDAQECVAAFLLRRPGWRHIVKRIQTTVQYPYGEVHDNLLGDDCLAVNLLRCKLSFFGAIKFDPRSDRWTRITLYQGAPAFSEINSDNADSWAFPVFVDQR